MTRKPLSFSPELTEATNLALKQDPGTQQVSSSSLDMSESVVQHWILQMTEESEGVITNGQTIAADQRRIQELEARCKRLETGIERLKSDC